MTLVLTYTFCSVANFFSLHISWLVAGIFFFHSSLENRFQYNAKKAKKRHTETDKKGKNDQRTASTKEFHFFGEETRGKKTQHNTWFIGGSQRWLHMAADIIFMYSCRNLRSIDERKTKRNKQWQQNNERVTCYIHISSSLAPPSISVSFACQPCKDIEWQRWAPILLSLFRCFSCNRAIDNQIEK